MVLGSKGSKHIKLHPWYLPHLPQVKTPNAPSPKNTPGIMTGQPTLAQGFH